MGKKDSSETRVWPVFNSKDKTGCLWLPKFLVLPKGGNPLNLPSNADFEIEEYRLGDNEKKLDLPISLLSWLIRHPQKLSKLSENNLNSDTEKDKKRKALLEGSNECLNEALNLLRNNPQKENWHIFEGTTQPDVFIKTPDFIIVIEGKRTEREPTKSTKWMKVRHQMLRHIDCAFEISGKRKVIGFFIVEGDGKNCDVPDKWISYAKETISSKVIESSLPHRKPEEQICIASSFIGVTTWQEVCKVFGMDYDKLPNETEE